VLDAGADGIETDVRLTADGVPVLSHDDIFGDGSITARPIADLPGIPRLDDLLGLAGGKTALYLELKVWRAGDQFHSASSIATAIAPAIEGIPNVTVSSFDPAAVATMHALRPGGTTGLGVLEGADPSWGIEAAGGAGHAELHVPEAAIDADFLVRAHDAGLRVLGFTVNSVARARTLADLGCDGVFTDDPSGLSAALR